MRCNDTWIGLLIIAAGIALFWEASTFPQVAGLPFGPGFFPSIIAVGLGICGLAITLRSVARRAVDGAPPEEEEVFRPSMSGVARLIGVAVCVAVFALILNPLGFHLSTILCLAALLMAFGVSIPIAALFSVPATFIIHFIFYSLLGVPLPWGLLTPIAW